MKIAIRQTGKLALAMSLLVGLTACGNDPTRTTGARIALDAVKTTAAGIGRGGNEANAPAQPDLGVLVQRALAATDGQVMIMAIEATNATVVMGPVATNGRFVTWKTADKRSFAFNRGVLTSTRGFGNDLMSAQADATTALITARRAGQARRVNNYLNGVGNTTALTLTCATRRGDQVRMQIGEINTTTTHLTETCTNGALSVQNQYWVDGRGKILKSRQWIGQAMGYVVTQQLRP